MAKRGRVKTPAEANNNWVAGMQAPQTATKFQQGVDSVSVAPNALAASPEAMQKYQQNTQAAIASGRMAAANNAVGVDKWKAATKQGAARLSQGAANNRAKHLASVQKMAAGWQQARDNAAAIPNDGSEASIAAKVLASVRAMKAAAGKT